MYKKIAFLLLAVSMTLAACQPVETPAATPTTAPAVDEPAAAPTTAGEVQVPAAGDDLITAVNCREVNILEAYADFPPVTENDWILGSDDAVFTITEYSDYQCPYCAPFAPVLEQMVAENPDQYRLVYRHFPLSFHANAVIAAQAAEAAGKQDKFFEMSALIFANQAEWAEVSQEEFATLATGYATELGLDVEQFTADFTSEETNKKVLADQAVAQEIGIPGTPFLFINGIPYQGNNTPEDIAAFVEILSTLKSLEPRQMGCPELAIDTTRTYTATITTDKGDIVVELYPDKAPFTVNSFIALANSGWYDGVSFHRVLPGFVAQTGDPSGTGIGNPGYMYNNEISDLQFDKPGILAMANSGPENNGSQFFITLDAQPQLNDAYTIFGQVISGMDVVESLTPRDPTQQGELPEGDKVLSITIAE